MSINTTGLLPPQFSHTQTLIDSLYLNGYAIDMSETGTGKTYVAAAIIREMNRPAFILCPKTVIPQWEKILRTFNLSATIINYEKIGRGNTVHMTWKKIQNLMTPWKPEAKEERPVFQMAPHSLVILDEGHRCKGDDTSNCKMMISLAEQGYKCLVSSATIATTPLEMKAIGFMTGLHALYNFTDFMRLHGAQWMGRWGAMTFDMASAESKKGMMLLHEHWFKTKKCASRLTVEDFGKLFPESHIVAEAFDLGSMEAKCQAVYDEMEAEIAKLDERCESYSEHIFAIMMEARRRAELCKVPLFVEMIEDLHDEGKSVCCFINFQDTADAITIRLEKSKKLKGQIGYIIGGQSDKARQQDIADFNADKKTVLVINIKAGGTGISLHDLIGNRARASIISPNYSAYELVQALGRIWRQGGLTKSYQRIVFAAKTIEEQACHRVQFRLNNLSTLNDADMRAGIKLFG
jgi:hypothetical protein